jgi:hypothetical protein
MYSIKNKWILFGLLCIMHTNNFPMDHMRDPLSPSTRDEHHRANQNAMQETLMEITRSNWEDSKKKIAARIEKDPCLVDTSEWTRQRGYTPLCYAVQENDVDFVKYLLHKGANPDGLIKDVHSSRSIFFAQSLEMVQFLQEHGANIHAYNEGHGWGSGMNFLHTAIHCTTEDDRLFDYALAQGLRPESLDTRGGNLWHSLIFCSACYCPEERLFDRAKKLHKLGISPYHRDYKGDSAIGLLKKEVASETEYLNSRAVEDERKSRTGMRDKLQRLIDFMEKHTSENNNMNTQE